MPLHLRLVKAVLAPGELFGNPTIPPAWFGVLLVATLVTAASPYALLTSERGRRMADAQRAESLELWRGRVPEERLKQIETAPLAYETTARMMALADAVSLLVSVFLLAAVTHFVLSVVFLRTEVTFQPILSVFSHAAVIWMLGAVFAAALSYGTMQPVRGTSLAALLPNAGWPPPSTFLGAVAASTNLFLAWWIPVVAVGLGKVYRTSPWRMGAGLAAVMLVLILVPAIFLRPAPGAGTGPMMGHGW